MMRIERILSFFMMDIGEYHPTFRGIARQYLPTCEARREIMPVNSDILTIYSLTIYPEARSASGYIAQPLWSILSNIPMPGPLYYHSPAQLITLLLCLLLYHTRMLIQRLQKWWIENPILLTCVKTIQNSAYSVILDSFYTREFGVDFSIHHF